MNRPSLAKDLKTVLAAGLVVTGIERLPDGGHRLLTAAANTNADADDELQRARERRRARKVDRAA